METQKLVKSVSSKIEKRMPLLWAFGLGIIALSLIANLVLYAYGSSAAFARDAWQESAFQSWKERDRLEKKNEDLKIRLDEMTETAGDYRAYEVYHDCVQQALGIYQMEEVSRAYDRHFRSPEPTGRCLAESAWYKTHPVGINPVHLSHTPDF